MDDSALGMAGAALPAIDPARAALFLDFDGVLAPIVLRPDMSAMSARTVATLARLRVATGGAVAVVSGRALDDLERKLVALQPPLPAAGSHGLERRLANGAVARVGGDPAVQTAIDRVVAFAESHGLLVERKAAGAAIHYREQPDLEAACLKTVESVAATAGLRVVHGKMIAEMSVASADKGTAVAAFMAEAPFRGRMPIVAGDDVTDEDAFRVVVAMGGIAIKVGDGPTAANRRAADIDEFLEWLAWLAGAG